MKYLWLLVAVVVVAGAGALFFMPKQAHAPKGHTVTIGSSTFAVEVADTGAARELGLGNRASLPAGHGMLFVFQSPGNWGFWMKDTKFPLDMLWVRGDGTITTIARDVATSSYPQVFYPAAPDASYVLEVNAGAAAGIDVGNKIVIQ